MLYAPNSWETFQEEFRSEVNSKILPVFGVSESEVAEIRLARWGHPLPVAAAGLIRNGVIEKIRKPHKGKVFFVEQDNWMLPAFETSVNEAISVIAEVRHVL